MPASTSATRTPAVEPPPPLLPSPVAGAVMSDTEIEGVAVDAGEDAVAAVFAP